jgi:hypothetical protein
VLRLLGCQFAGIKGQVQSLLRAFAVYTMATPHSRGCAVGLSPTAAVQALQKAGADEVRKLRIIKDCRGISHPRRR